MNIQNVYQCVSRTPLKYESSLSKRVLHSTYCETFPRVIHYIYFGNIPIEYFTGDDIQGGLLDVLNRAEQENYIVCFWSDEFSYFKKVYNDIFKISYALCDKIFSSRLIFRNVSEIYSWIKPYFSDKNLSKYLINFQPAGSLKFHEWLELTLTFETYDDANIVSASNILRYLILIREGGIYYDLSKGIVKSNSSQAAVRALCLKGLSFNPLEARTTFKKKDEYSKELLVKGFEKNFLIMSTQNNRHLINTIAIIVTNYSLLHHLELDHVRIKTPASSDNMRLRADDCYDMINRKLPFTWGRCIAGLTDAKNNAVEFMTGTFPFSYPKMYALSDLEKFDIDTYKEHININHTYLGIKALVDEFCHWEFVSDADFHAKGPHKIHYQDTWCTGIKINERKAKDWRDDSRERSFCSGFSSETHYKFTKSILHYEKSVWHDEHRFAAIQKNIPPLVFDKLVINIKDGNVFYVISYVLSVFYLFNKPQAIMNSVSLKRVKFMIHEFITHEVKTRFNVLTGCEHLAFVNNYYSAINSYPLLMHEVSRKITLQFDNDFLLSLFLVSPVS